jgi:hypothetical protein
VSEPRAPRPTAPYTNAAIRRSRLELGRYVLADFPPDQVELFREWLAMLPAPEEGSFHDPVTNLSCAITGDGRRLTWRADVDAEPLIEPMSSFCVEWGADAAELDRLAAVGATFDPHRLGTWIESRPEGYDLGWAMSGRWALREFAGALPVPRSAPHDVVVTDVARSLATGAPTTRLVIELAGSSLEDHVHTASERASELSVPLPSDALLGVLLNEASGPLTMGLWLVEDDVAATGLATPAPSTTLIVALAHQLDAVDELEELARFGESLLVEGPASLELRRRGAGDEFELRYDIPAAPPAIDPES